ncbi:unnamed protein product, partial [Rotaria socialis]
LFLSYEQTQIIKHNLSDPLGTEQVYLTISNTNYSDLAIGIQMNTSQTLTITTRYAFDFQLLAEIINKTLLCQMESYKFSEHDILEQGLSDQFTNHGKILGKLPDFGSVQMSRCVLSSLQEYSCGRDLICLASILSVLNTTTIFKSSPSSFKSPDGDFMTLLNIMNEALLVKQSVPA